jgi:hypothetical protein
MIGTYLKSALSSLNPEARACTAEDVPMLRRANMARYRTNSGNFVSINELFKDNIFDSEVSSELIRPERRGEVGGAGSIEVYNLDRGSTSAACII